MRRWRCLLVRKGRFYLVPSTPTVQVQHDAAPTLIVRRRPVASVPRRGSFQPFPWPVQPDPLPSVCRPRRAIVPSIRQGAFWPVVPVSSPVVEVPVERGGMSPASHATASMQPAIRSGVAMRATSI